MNTLLLTIKLLQPLLLSSPAAGEENSAVSLDYIPGSVVRGALIERFLQHNKGTDPLNHSLAKRLFFSNEVLYLNGYLADHRGTRGLPTPFSWAVEKDSENDISSRIYDLALWSTNELPDELKDPKSLKKPFCWTEVSDEDEFEVQVTAVVASPKRQPQLHNASEMRFVKREADSTLFRYDALAAGQRFGAAILCVDTTLATEVRALLAPQELLFGRSRSAGYGRVTIEQITESLSWSEYNPAPNATHQQIVLTLLSDAILRQPETGAYTTDLRAALKIRQKLTKAFVASGITGGFNRTWGMPLTQSPMLRAGNVWVFEHDAELAKTLSALVAMGIGERRNEGFGRLALNWQSTPELSQQAPENSRALSRPVTLGGADATLAQAMVNRLYRQQLDHRLLEHGTGALEIQGRLENAQLSRLRTLVRQAEQAQQPQLVHDFLKSLRDTAKTQFRRARLDGKPLLRWLEEGWKEEGLWKAYFYITPSSRPTLGNVTAQDELPLRLEYMARLVDVVCKRAIQKEQARLAQAQQKEGVA